MTATVAMFVVSLVCILLVAFRTRRAIRGLWSRLENLQQQLRAARIAQNEASNQVYSDLASHIHNKTISFQSQHGEDVFLWNYFERKSDGTCVEVGAFDGKSCSNTYAFEALGWKCILVEPDPEMADRCRMNRPESDVVQAAVGGRDASGTITFNKVRSDADWSGMMSFTEADPVHLEKCKRLNASIESVTVPHRSLNEILKDVTGPIDFMTIDVEGHEMEVLDGLDLERFRPTVLVTECTYDRERDLVGQYLAARNYERVTTVGCNHFFTRIQSNGNDRRLDQVQSS